jgi:hypothetical protein
MKCHGEAPLNNENTLKNERLESKTGPVRGWVIMGGGRVAGDGKGGVNMVDVLYILV